MALSKLGEKTAQGVSLMHYLRFVGGSLGTAIATNTLEKSLALHFEGITTLQNVDVVQRYIDTAADRLEIFFPDGLAAAKAEALVGRIQQLQASSLAFQDTFRHGFIFAVIGSVFLLLILVTDRRQQLQDLTKR